MPAQLSHVTSYNACRMRIKMGAEMAESYSDVGLVLEGGAMRGLFTAAVTDVLLEQDIELGGVAAVSAGATFGCNYKSHQRGRALRYNLRFHNDPHYGTLRSWLRTGDLYEAEYCYRTIPQELDVFDGETFISSPVDFWAVCTDVATGQPVYHLCTDAGEVTLDWIRASASMPIVSRPVKLDGMELLDGGISDPIPLRFLEKQGYRKNVVVLTQPRAYTKKQSPAFMGFLLRKQPAIAKSMSVRHVLYNDTRNFVFGREAAGSAFIICPDEPLPVSRTDHDPEHLKAAYDHGREVMTRELEALREFLSA